MFFKGPQVYVFQPAQFPTAPGVYLMKDANGAVLYVGKATRLRTRVRSYFREDADSRYQIQALLKRVATIETIVTDTEKEALLLEHTLIRRHRPRYNIFFRDDKSYMSVKVNRQHAFPGVFRTRKVLKDGADYFGPYPSGAACRETIDMVTRFFRLRTCRDLEFANRSRPCIQYQIGRCTAPCVGLVDPAAYARQVEQALLLLRGKQNELTTHVTAQMRTAAQAEHFEEAARLRDLLRDIATTVEPQKMVRHAAIDRDYIGWAEEEARGAIAVLEVRGGQVTARGGAVVPLGAASLEMHLASFVLQYYQAPRLPPPEICIPCDPVGWQGVTDCLRERGATLLRWRWPRRGAEAKLLRLASVNALALCRSERSAAERWTDLCEQLRRALHLAQAPQVIECVDISNWQGSEAGGAIVAFAEGEAAKARYRHYRIRGPQQPNDYAMMREVITRRLSGPAALPAPDLLLVDGGKGQLQVAQRVCAELAVELPLAAIAKAREGESTDKIYLPQRKNPLPLRAGHPALLFLQRVRDEAHRFAITQQRRRQRKRLRGAT